MSTIATNIMTKFDVQDVVVVIRKGIYTNTAGVVVEIVQVGAPGHTAIMYRVEMLNGNTITVDESDLIDFETWLDDQDDLDGLNELNADFGEDIKDKKCECGSEKVNSNRHSSWCPKHVS
tara:strand:+ start:142 stop:501 length:360 start_codon:yes stop_codon:yes gene_type:complete